MDNAQNIGYIIPSVLVQNFIYEYVSRGRWGGVPEPGFTYRSLESAPLRDFLEVPRGMTGVQITSVAPLGALKESVNKGEVLLEIDDQSVSNEGTIRLRPSSCSDLDIQIPFEHLITSKRRSEKTKLSVLRQGRRVQTVVVEFAPIPPLLSRFEGYDAQPSYFIFGGLVFTRLSTPLLHEYSISPEENKQTFPRVVLEKARTWREQDEEVLLLLHVLKHTVNEGIETPTARLLVSVNGQEVNKMKDLVKTALSVVSSGDIFVQFGFHRPSDECGGNTTVEILRAQDVMEANEEILDQHLIPSAVSLDLADVYERYVPELSDEEVERRRAATDDFPPAGE
eukprot:gnl/TRDRNA2_/TRDRNA2_160986_c1_seq1.p1 gnl/TRDRNA2_/TRDRNA2_160986_c1~~gnl/TRDRNA2_/TRDRNA2_160986_c1_seq1.p1  ORF type:complete len:368 (-),score=57.88 gnl/TRDRNA2_/TRDRNA2_160986_c1_seq1:130-1146(-)